MFTLAYTGITMKLASPKVFSILQVKRPADVSAEGHGAQLALEFSIQNVPLYLLSHIDLYLSRFVFDKCTSVVRSKG